MLLVPLTLERKIANPASPADLEAGKRGRRWTEEEEEFDAAVEDTAMRLGIRVFRDVPETGHHHPENAYVSGIHVS